jgi:hypothetical protein
VSSTSEQARDDEQAQRERVRGMREQLVDGYGNPA